MSEDISCDLCGSKGSYILYDKTELLKLPLPLRIVQCCNCGLVYQNPRMTESEYETYFDSNYYNSWGYLEIVEQKAKEYSKMLSLIEKELGIKGKVLEIGCGTGHFLKAAKDKGWQVIGIEISKWSADYGKINFNLDIRKLKFEEAHFGQREFDVVILSHVAEHLLSPIKAFKIIYEILRDGGLLLVEVPNEFEQLMFIIAGKWIRKWLYNRHKGPIMHHFYFFTKETLTNMLNKSGFEILSVKTLKEDMLIRSKIFGGSLVKKILYKMGALIGRGPIIEVLSRKRCKES